MGTDDREGLENLYNESWGALQPAPGKLAKQEKPEAKYERKRRRYTWSDVGEIEREFGDPRAGVWQTNPFLAPLIAGSWLSCLDEILAGGGVTMIRLQELFGMNRERFPKLPVPPGHKKLYDFSAVVEIMCALLKRRKRRRQGAPLRRWLEKPAVRARVLSGIAWRITYVGARPEIAGAFQALISKVA